MEERQVPDFMGANGFYGISRCGKKEWENEYWEDTHGVWLDGGVLPTSPLPDVRIRWDFQAPGAHALSTTSQSSSTFDSAGK